jgi:hypothetical protein
MMGGAVLRKQNGNTPRTHCRPPSSLIAGQGMQPCFEASDSSCMREEFNVIRKGISPEDICEFTFSANLLRIYAAADSILVGV